MRERTQSQMALLNMVRQYQALQKVRVGNTNQFHAMLKYAIIPEDMHKALIAERVKPFEKQEKAIIEDAAQAIETMPVWTEWLQHVRGINKCLAVQFIAWLQPIADFPTVSHLCSYSGYRVDENGRAPRRTRGKKLEDGVPAIKRLGYQAAECFVRSKGAFAEIYNLYKARITVQHPEPVDSGRKSKDGKPIMDYTKIHLHKMALRYTAKRFLTLLWQAWRELEGLPTREPYVVEYLGHKIIMSPWSLLDRERELTEERDRQAAEPENDHNHLPVEESLCECEPVDG